MEVFKMGKRLAAILLCLGMTAGMLGGCSMAGETDEEISSMMPEPSSEVSEPESQLESEPEEPEDTGPRNPLTGETGFSESAVGLRPVTVMINNIGQALPQRGLAAADVIFEAVVEGGITRMMGVYADIDQIPYVGPVRSARHYYVSFSEGLNAIYTHFGGSPTAYDYISSYAVDDVDGQYCTSAFYQDTWRAQTYAGNTASLSMVQLSVSRLSRKESVWRVNISRCSIFRMMKCLSRTAEQRTMFSFRFPARITPSSSTMIRPAYTPNTATVRNISMQIPKRPSPLKTC